MRTVAAWLERFEALRNRGREDPRYERLLERAGGHRFRFAVLHVFGPQGLLIWLIAMPIQVSATSGAGSRPVLALGLAVWALGLVFEAVGDAQLARFKSDAATVAC